MEISLYIHRENALHLVDDPSKSRFFQGLDRRIRELIDKQGYKRLNFGSESCENCMPSLDAIRSAQDIAQSRGLAFTFVTPFCTEKGIDRLADSILPYLDGSGAEIVCNDFGVLYMISQSNYQLKPVIGRLLSKSKKWPLGEVAPEFAKSVQQSPFGIVEYQEYLKRLSFDTVEIDNRAEGYDTELERLPFNIALHMPFVYLTSGRMCFLSGQEKPDNERFGIAKGCKMYCNSQLVQINGRFYSNGKAVYAVNDDTRNLDAHNISRLIISPSL